MHHKHSLAALAPGRRAVVTDVDAGEAMRTRLLGYGITPGTPIVCVQKSPLGDPTAYGVRGAVVALRRCDAACIRIHTEEVAT